MQANYLTIIITGTNTEWSFQGYESMRGIGLIRLRIGIIGEPLLMWNLNLRVP